MSESFEDKLNKLEEIVKELESGEVPLEKAIEKYTDAMALIRDCDEKLKEVAEKVKIVHENGTITELKEE
jgi:exodeoxyribonuclease VII small subunit